MGAKLRPTERNDLIMDMSVSEDFVLPFLPDEIKRRLQILQERKYEKKKNVVLPTVILTCFDNATLSYVEPFIRSDTSLILGLVQDFRHTQIHKGKDDLTGLSETMLRTMTHPH